MAQATTVGDLIVKLDLDATDYHEEAARVTKEIKEGEVSREAKKQEKSLNSLLNSIDPVTNAYSNLDKQYALLVEHLNAGRINDDVFSHYNNVLDQTRTKLAGTGDAAAAAAKKQSAALKSLLESIDPDIRAVNQLDEQYSQLVDHLNAGRITGDQFTHFNSILNNTRQQIVNASEAVPAAMSKQAIAAQKAGISIGQYNAAMRTVPAQMTDIATQLAGGQNPLLILLQQGGQIKDMFGGFRPALVSLASSISATTLAVTGLATAGSALVYAYYQGNSTLSDFNKTLTLTGNTAGLTAQEMLNISEAGKKADLTFGQTRESLNALVNAGVKAGAEFDDLSVSVARFTEASGQPVEDVAKAFGKLTNDPTSGLIAMAEQFHNVTAEQIDYVAALQRSGNEAAALQAANKAATDGFNDQTDQIRENMGTLEQAADSLSHAFKSMWDAVLDVGRPDSSEEILSKAQAEFDRAEAALANGQNSFFQPKHALESLQKNRDAAKAALDTAKQQVEKAKQDAAAAKDKSAKESDQLKYAKQAETNYARLQTATEKYTKRQKELNDALKEGRILQADYNTNMAAAKKEYDDAQKKDHKKPKSYTESAGQQLLDQLNQQNEALARQTESSEKLSSATSQRIQFEKQIAELQGKDQLTAQQKSLLSMSDQLLAAYQLQETLTEQVNVQKEYDKMQTELQGKEEKLRDATADRLRILEQMKTLGKITPEEYDRTSKDVADHAVTDMPKDVQRLMRKGGEHGGILGTFAGDMGQLDQLNQQQADLDNWFEQNLKSIDEYRQSRADLNVQWDEEEAKVRAEHATAEAAIEEQKRQIITTSIQSGLDSMVDITKTAFGEKSAIYKATFMADKAYAIAQSMVAIQTGIAEASANPYPYNLVAMASVAAATAGIVANIQSVALVGMAHDGIDNVPETGTWLLQQGERVTTAGTSAKLDATLEEIRSGQGTSFGSTYAPTFNVPGSGRIHPDDMAMMKSMAIEVGKAYSNKTYDKIVSETASGTGKMGNSLKGKWAAGRKIG